MLIGSNMAFMAGSRDPITGSQTAYTSDTGGSSTHTFTSQAIGAAASNRTVVVGVTGQSWGTSTGITSVTIGGVSATQIVNQNFVAASNSGAAIWSAIVPTGTTATIVVVFNGTPTTGRTGLFVWALYGVGTSVGYSTTGDPANVSTHCNAGGYIMAIGHNAAGYNISVTGSTALGSVTPGGVVYSYSEGAAYATAQSGLTLGMSGGDASNIIAAASFNP